MWLLTGLQEGLDQKSEPLIGGIQPLACAAGLGLPSATEARSNNCKLIHHTNACLCLYVCVCVCLSVRADWLVQAPVRSITVWDPPDLHLKLDGPTRVVSEWVGLERLDMRSCLGSGWTCAHWSGAGYSPRTRCPGPSRAPSRSSQHCRLCMCADLDGRVVCLADFVGVC